MKYAPQNKGKAMKYLNDKEIQDTKETEVPHNRSVSGYGMKMEKNLLLNL